MLTTRASRASRVRPFIRDKKQKRAEPMRNKNVRDEEKE